jgi:hypothetical protein
MKGNAKFFINSFLLHNQVTLVSAAVPISATDTKIRRALRFVIFNMIVSPLM